MNAHDVVVKSTGIENVTGRPNDVKPNGLKVSVLASNT